ncbi:methyl farnesoate epoxidase-like isoform X3 [Daktulosphaira vitifoliae]|uniref:methyl farnesoate epoxidase-like isoform X1 n=1 Tax=Daktulosphaira vitifoliae TaxID=58002 RepID=UPI0021AA7247|nr:methyl farnesoate epoxidase-like isoform X1 [Daktulosphaira vitifoliae]XP_050521558.1 methyl farnesoate epoxidase-like isoform X2 [Daktulosphaira vitifoliae]XP_050521559.1 methyl farnesoate epoxidase-like isoform X3 [Daktulosphaira vitifoliae]
MLFAVVIIFVLIIFCILDIITPHKYPIGPKRFPLVGSYLEIRKLRQKLGFYHLVWDHLSQQFGQVFSVKLGRIEAVVVTGYDAVRQVLCKDDFDGRPDGFFFRFRAFYKRLGIVFVDGPMWTEQRKFCMQHLRKMGFGSISMEKLINEEVNNLLLDLIRRSDNGNKPIDVNGLFDVSVLNGLWAMLAGQRFGLYDSKLAKLMELTHVSFRMLDMSGGILNQMPFIRFLAPKCSGYRDIKHILHEFYTFLKASVEDHKHRVNDEEDLICAFLKEIEKNKESTKSFSEEQLLVLLLDLFLAGSETTSSTLSFVILHLLRNQSVQDKVHAELDAAVGDREVLLSDKNNLTYLEAVLMEVQRHSNVAPIAIAHRSIRKTSLQEYKIPNDTLILASIWSVHMDKQHWGDPENFRPERFLNETGQIINDSWFIPFGIGRRRCLGEVLAKTNVFMFVAKILQNFELKVPEGVQLPDIHQEGVTVSPSPFSALFIPRRSFPNSDKRF